MTIEDACLGLARYLAAGIANKHSVQIGFHKLKPDDPDYGRNATLRVLFGCFWITLQVLDLVYEIIVVHPDQQCGGHGAALMRHVEQALAARGERVLLVETSGLASFERTRASYDKLG